MIKGRNFIALAIVAVLAACGGGGGGGSSVPSGGNAAATPTPGALPTAVPITSNELVSKVSITMAKGTYAAAAVRKAQTVGQGTVSISFVLLQENGVPATSAAQSFGLTSSSPGCIVNAQSNLVCTIGVAAPVDPTATGATVDVFTATTYDANGNVTGSGAVALSVALNSANSASIVLNAQVSSVFLLAVNTFLGIPDAKARHAGTQAVRRTAQTTDFTTSQLYVVALDSSGNVILNPSAYSSPIYVQQGFDWYNGFQYTADTTLTAAYSGNDAAGGVCSPGATVSASGWYASLPLCSPADVMSVGFAPSGGSYASYDVYLYAWTSPSQLVPTPAPSMSPEPLPTPSGNNYLDIGVNYPPTPTPSPQPTCTTNCGTLPVTGQ